MTIIVFSHNIFRVGEISAAKLASESFDEVDLSRNPSYTNTQILDPGKNTGWSLFTSQIHALLEKKATATKRQWIYMLLQVF